MLTFFSIPKPFVDEHISNIQKNAILSWKNLSDKIEIYLMGNEQGIKEAAEELKVKHLPQVEKNEFGTPLLDSAFRLVRENCRNDIIAYLNADIILLDDFLAALEIMPKDNFLAVGQRWDLDVNEPIDFSDKNWQNGLRTKVMKTGRLHSPAGMDYFIFNKNSFQNIPAFAVGRVGWDNWMVREARRSGMKVIDASNLITAIHQNHEYRGVNLQATRKTNAEAKKNIELANGGGPEDYTIEDADYEIVGNRIKKRHLYWWPYYKRVLKSKLK